MESFRHQTPGLPLGSIHTGVPPLHRPPYSDLHPPEASHFYHLPYLQHPAGSPFHLLSTTAGLQFQWNPIATSIFPRPATTSPHHLPRCSRCHQTSTQGHSPISILPPYPRLDTTIPTDPGSTIPIPYHLHYRGLPTTAGTSLHLRCISPSSFSSTPQADPPPYPPSDRTLQTAANSIRPPYHSHRPGASPAAPPSSSRGHHQYRPEISTRVLPFSICRTAAPPSPSDHCTIPRDPDLHPRAPISALHHLISTSRRSHSISIDGDVRGQGEDNKHGGDDPH